MTFETPVWVPCSGRINRKTAEVIGARAHVGYVYFGKEVDAKEKEWITLEEARRHHLDIEVSGTTGICPRCSADIINRPRRNST